MTAPLRVDFPEDIFARPEPIPRPPPTSRGLAPVAGGANLFFIDTGGGGPAVILSHPATGSAHMWPYQLPVFAAAGFRVIAYSRRGYSGSSPLDVAGAGVASDDLEALADHLKLETFACVASAAGCSVLLDFAASRSSRLSAAIFSGGSFSGLAEPEHEAAVKRVALPGFEEMPSEFKELGPSYRAANPAGAEAWIALERKACLGPRPSMRRANRLDWKSVAGVSAPSLFVAGAADLYAPPALLRQVAARVPASEFVILAETGHSAYWERPSLFNDVAVDFLRRRAR